MANPDPSDQENIFSCDPEKDIDSDNIYSLLDVSGFEASSELNKLQILNKQLKLDLQAEQDTVQQLRKKLNNAEKQKLEAASRSNSEIGSLESQAAKLRAQVEKGEALRQNLEFELTKSQRDLDQMRNASKEKEHLFKDSTEDLKQKVHDFNDEVKRLQKSLQASQESAAEQEAKLRQEMQDSYDKLVKTQAETETIMIERDKANDLCLQQSRVISELNNKLQEFGGEKSNVIDGLRRATAELEYSKQREERFQSDIDTAWSRIKNLEENIEAERAAHLETKFNSEIVQLRVRDLDSAIDVERSANTEANKAIERLTQQNRELEQVYEEERKSKKEIKEKYDKFEKDQSESRRQVLLELEDKKVIVKNLSKELETHRKNFSDLKSELSKAKKRQTFLEETYGAAIKELEFLLKTFHFDDKRLRFSSKKDDQVKGKKLPNPTAVVDSFKEMLPQLKKKIDSQTEDVTKAKKQCDRLSKELDSMKELIKEKDKKIEETQKNYSKTAKDLSKARSNFTELESSVVKLKTTLHTNAALQDKDRTRIHELSEEIMKLVKRHKSDEEEKIAFLHSLYQRLLSSHLLVTPMDKQFNQFSWTSLTDMIYEQVSSLLDLLQLSDEKLKKKSLQSRDRDEVIATLKQEHHEQISRLTQLSQDREATWTKRKEEMEQHYNHMLSQSQATATKNQAMADQAWEKLRAGGKIQEGLESEVVELRHELAETQVQNSCLLSASALLSGALIPLYDKYVMLKSERRCLEQLYVTWEESREQALFLTHVLNEDQLKSSKKSYPLLRFRVGCVAVLAANRLKCLGKTSKQCFVSGNQHDGIPVCIGDTKLRAYAVTCAEYENEVPNKSLVQETEANLSSWLKNSDLLEVVVGSMAELHETFSQDGDTKSQGAAKANILTTRSCFTKLIDKLTSFFPHKLTSTSYSKLDKSSLARQLERRLSSILQDTPHHLKGNMVSMQELMSNLQNHILDLTKGLHSTEKERRKILASLNELKQQIGDEGSNDNEKNSLQGTKYVSMTKFERVCLELSSALKREQKAQSLLQEQSNQLTELTKRLEDCASQGLQNENRMTELQEGYTEAQAEMRHKEKNLRQLNKQVSQIEYERDTVKQNLMDAENALRTTSRDKEVLIQYVQNVEESLERAKQQFLLLREAGTHSHEVTLAKTLLNVDLIPQEIGKAGPELIALQNLVGSFVDCQHQALNKIKLLEEELESYKQHAVTLKAELNKALHREFSQHVESVTDGAIILQVDETKDNQNFVELKSEPQEGYNETPVLISPPGALNLQTSNSAFHSVKSSKKSPDVLK